MAGRRILYLAVLGGCLVFYWAYREWFSWFLLVGVVCLPWLSLLLSALAMLNVRMAARCPARLPLAGEGRGTLKADCLLPIPPVRGRLRVTNAMTGEQWKQKNGSRLPAVHCGLLKVEPMQVWVCDYLGLFRLPVRRRESASVLVEPVPVPAENPPDLSRYLTNAWKPKPGGGFAENHELRLYRSGDNLRQIHWKLSAKTGKLILREPMEPLRGLALLTMELSGTPEELDWKLGRLLWMSRYLLRQEVSHEIRCLTARGTERFSVRSEEDLGRAVDVLLCAPAAAPGAEIGAMSASWQCHIGGGADEN